MFSWFNRQSAAPTPILSRRWENPGLTAEEVDVSRGRSGTRTARRMQLTANGTRFNLHPAELRDLVSGRMGIVESMENSDLAFFVRSGPDLAGTDAFHWTRELPEGSLVLLAAPMTEPPLAVLSGADVKSFSAWVQELPR